MKDTFALVCKIPLLARALGLKARPSARATIGYLASNLSSAARPRARARDDRVYCKKVNICIQDLLSSHARLAECTREQRYLAYNVDI